MAEVFNFSVDQGADTDVIITYRPGGVAFDFTGYTLEAMLRRNISDTSPALTLSSQGGSPTIVASGDQVTLTFKGLSTASLVDSYFYDVVATATSSSAKRRVAEGKVAINPAVTRSA